MPRSACGVDIVATVVLGPLGLLLSPQRRLIYVPSPEPVPPAATVLRRAQDVSLRTGDGLRLGAWFLPAPGAGRAPAVVVCNGNGGDRLLRTPLAVALNGLGMAVLLFDYRGYGANPGRPTEEGLAADVRAARSWLDGRAGDGLKLDVYFGESLGAAVAVRMALERPPAALVLRSPFTSLADVGRALYPWLPVKYFLLDRYPSIDRVGKLAAPLLVIAAERDTIVPAGLSRRLYDAAPEPKQYMQIPGVDHNDVRLLDGPEMIGEVERFLRKHAVL